MATSSFNAVAGAVNGKITGNLVYSKEYHLPSSVSVPANGTTTAFGISAAGLPTGADVICARINTYNQEGTPNLIAFPARWYSTSEIKVFNTTSSAVTMPAGLGIVIYYKL